MSSNTYSPELGRAGTAVINVVTKSGTNHLHGSSFFYFRNSEMDAQHPFMDFKPPSNQEQFGFTVGGPIKRNRLFFFAGYDQHAFHIPAVVRFLNGSAMHHAPSRRRVRPLPGTMSLATRRWYLPQPANSPILSGNYPAKLLGNAGFFKLDYSITPRNQLSARLSTSRYYGTNNVFFDPASPLTTYAISDNGEESVATESASLSLTSGLSAKITSHLRAQISRDLQQSEQQLGRSAHSHLQRHRWLWAVIHPSAPDPRTQTSPDGNLQPGGREKYLEIRRRRVDHANL